MKYQVAVLMAILILASAVPFTEGATDRRSLDITLLIIDFKGTDAIFTVNYDIGGLAKIYILLIGSKSLEPKIKSIFSEFDYEIIKMDADSAVLKVRNISRFDKGYYLHDSRRFGENIKTIYIYTPDSSRPKEYSNLNSTPAIFYRS